MSRFTVPTRVYFGVPGWLGGFTFVLAVFHLDFHYVVIGVVDIGV
jgi:hypothetical protein